MSSIDTAGVRRRGRVFETVEKFSIVKTLQAIERAQVVLLVVDAPQALPIRMRTSPDICSSAVARSCWSRTSGMRLDGETRARET